MNDWIVKNQNKLLRNTEIVLIPLANNHSKNTLLKLQNRTTSNNEFNENTNICVTLLRLKAPHRTKISIQNLSTCGRNFTTRRKALDITKVT